MMRIGTILVAALIALGNAAFASPPGPADRYDHFGTDYSRLIARAEILAADAAEGRIMAEALDAFSAQLTGLAKKLDREGGPHDLACIYRGIVKDLAKQRRAGATGDNQAGAQEKLAALLHDAALVTPAPPKG